MRPRVCKKRGSAGAETLRSCRDERAASRRPRRLLAVPRVRSHRQRAFGPALARFGRASRVQDLELLRAHEDMERRCATGVRAGCCQACTASIRGPGIRGELNLASDARDGADACLNRVTAPAPQSRSADASHVDRGAGRIGAARGAGISFFSICHPGQARRHPSAEPGPSMRRAEGTFVSATTLTLGPGSRSGVPSLARDDIERRRRPRRLSTRHPGEGRDPRHFQQSLLAQEIAALTLVAANAREALT